MNTPRLATSTILRASRSSLPKVARQLRVLPSARIPALPSFIASSHFRPYSHAPNANKIYFFEDVQAHLSNPSTDRILIDTREPSELQATGTIPGSINIPITSKPDSFFISAEEFEDRMGFERPGKEKEVVFYCKAGVRSATAAELARQAGWERVGEYSGSWLDWEKRGGEKEAVR
ncbi:rhodanese domain-containing protein [Hyaloscypha finlandica]|nr:rhodanese domain-containing protein [Hyaloscypha finlandica]